MPTPERLIAMQQLYGSESRQGCASLTGEGDHDPFAESLDLFVDVAEAFADAAVVFRDLRVGLALCELECRHLDRVLAARAAMAEGLQPVTEVERIAR